jgi:hypothetical protein
MGAGGVPHDMPPGDGEATPLSPRGHVELIGLALEDDT